MEGRELRRSVTLLEQLSVVDSSSIHLRDLLKVREEEDSRLSGRRGDGLTLGSVIASEKREGSAAGVVGGRGRGRTLLDIIRDEQEMHGGVLMDGSSGNGMNWKAFRDRLRLRRAANDWADEAAASAVVQPSPISDPELLVPVRPNPIIARSASPAVSIGNERIPALQSVSRHVTFEAVYDTHASAAASEPSAGGEISSSDVGGDTEVPEPAAEEQPMRVSLMSLLEQTDRQWSGSPAAATAALDEDDDEVDEAAAEEVGGGRGMPYVCCVCMVRHKGAAFIPCGHTFCRLCSRELWVSRGSCPLCNGYILEILDIF